MSNAMSKDELLEKLKTLLRFSIATTLKIKAPDYSASIETQNAVNNCLTVVMAIGYNKALYEAVDDLSEYYLAFWGGDFDRHKLEIEVQRCYDTFRPEIVAFASMHEMNELNVVPDDILNFVSADLEIDESYDALRSDYQ
jgi:hypothetical protein